MIGRNKVSFCCGCDTWESERKFLCISSSLDLFVLVVLHERGSWSRDSILFDHRSRSIGIGIALLPLDWALRAIMTDDRLMTRCMNQPPPPKLLFRDPSPSWWRMAMLLLLRYCYCYCYCSQTKSKHLPKRIMRVFVKESSGGCLSTMDEGFFYWREGSCWLLRWKLIVAMQSRTLTHAHHKHLSPRIPHYNSPKRPKENL